MSVRKREWHTNKQAQAFAQELGIDVEAAKKELSRVIREKDTGLLKRYPAERAWLVDYTDQAGQRQVKQLRGKKEADDYLTKVKHEVKEGVHTAVSKSITVKQAAEDWLGYVRGEGRERSTVERYRQLVDHILPRLGNEKLARLTSPRINAFRDDLLKSMSRATAKKVLTVLKAILKDAKRRGNVAQNVAADVSITAHGRLKPKLEIGRDIPTRDEIQRIIDAAAPGKPRTLLMTAALTGMRASSFAACGGRTWI